MSTVWCSAIAAVSASREAGCDDNRVTNGPNVTTRNRASSQADLARRVTRSKLTDLAELPFHFVDLVAQAGGLLEAQVARRLVHLVGEGLDQPPQLVARQIEPVDACGRSTPASPPPAARGRVVAVGTRTDHLQDVGDLLAHRLRVDAVGRVVRDL